MDSPWHDERSARCAPNIPPCLSVVGQRRRPGKSFLVVEIGGGLFRENGWEGEEEKKEAACNFPLERRRRRSARRHKLKSSLHWVFQTCFKLQGEKSEAIVGTHLRRNEGWGAHKMAARGCKRQESGLGVKTEARFVCFPILRLLRHLFLGEAFPKGLFLCVKGRFRVGSDAKRVQPNRLYSFFFFFLFQDDTSRLNEP